MIENLSLNSRAKRLLTIICLHNASNILKICGAISTFSGKWKIYTFMKTHVHYLDTYTQLINLTQSIFKIKLHINILVLLHMTGVFTFQRYSFICIIWGTYMKIRAHSFRHIHIAHKYDSDDLFKIKLHITIQVFWQINCVFTLQGYFCINILWDTYMNAQAHSFRHVHVAHKLDPKADI